MTKDQDTRQTVRDRIQTREVMEDVPLPPMRPLPEPVTYDEEFYYALLRQLQRIADKMCGPEQVPAQPKPEPPIVEPPPAEVTPSTESPVIPNARRSR